MIRDTNILEEIGGKFLTNRDIRSSQIYEDLSIYPAYFKILNYSSKMDAFPFEQALPYRCVTEQPYRSPMREKFPSRNEETWQNPPYIRSI